MYKVPFLLLLLGFFASGLRAQIPEPIPDTLDWKGYFPIEIGNEWHYQTETYDFWPGVEVDYFQMRIVGDTTLDANHYFVLHYSRFVPPDTISNPHIDFIRYDTTSATVVEYARLTDGSWREICYLGWLCELDGDFYGEESGVPGGRWVQETYPQPLVIAPDTVHDPAYKVYSYLLGGHTVVHGLGWVRNDQGDRAAASSVTKLIYARVGDQTWGTNLVLTSTQQAEVPAAHFSIASLYPNPLRTTATVLLQIDQAAFLTIATYDMRGRLVRRERRHFSPGVHSYLIQGEEFPSGPYLLRVMDEQGPFVSRTFIIIR